MATHSDIEEFLSLVLETSVVCYSYLFADASPILDCLVISYPFIKNVPMECLLPAVQGAMHRRQSNKKADVEKPLLRKDLQSGETNNKKQILL